MISKFKFKYFELFQGEEVHKFGTDAMVLAAFATNRKKSFKNILDIGTGTGVMALMLAQKFTDASVTGLDINEKAIVLADLNFKNAPFTSRMKLIKSDFLEFNSSEKFDLIVTNPPYYNSSYHSPQKHKNLAKHEQNMSLSMLIERALQMLEEKGEFWLIIPSERTDKLLDNKGFKDYLIQKISIFGKPNVHFRDILVFSQQKTGEFREFSFVIRNEEEGYSEEYINLTKDFHYNLNLSK